MTIAEQFPKVNTVSIYVRAGMAGVRPKVERHFTEASSLKDGEGVPCRNSLCEGRPGLPLSVIEAMLRKAVNGRAGSAKTEHTCQGREKMGRGQHRYCAYFYEVAADITYRPQDDATAGGEAEQT